MKFSEEGYLLTEKEFKRIEEIEIEKNGKKIKMYLIKNRKRNQLPRPTKEELIILILEKKRIEELAEHYNCSLSYLRKYLMNYFKSKKFGDIKLILQLKRDYYN